jgi:hypothetical protein
MPRDAWESLHGGSRKWFPEQRPRSPESGTEQRLLAPLPITGTSAPTSLKHQVRTAARPSMPKPGQDSRQRHRPNSDRHEEWTPRSVDKRVLAHNADSARADSGFRQLSGAAQCRPDQPVLHAGIAACGLGLQQRGAVPGRVTALPVSLGSRRARSWCSVAAGRSNLVSVTTTRCDGKE